MKHRNRIITTLIVFICMVVAQCGTSFAGWHSDDNSIEKHYGTKKITLEVRYWMSGLSVNFSKSKITFDAKSSSWVFVEGEANTYASSISKDHQNWINLEKKGLTGSLTISSNPTGVTGGVNVSQSSEDVATLTTAPRNTYYQGISAYNLTITRGVGGILASWCPITAIATGGCVTGYSWQKVTIWGDTTYNHVSVTNWY